MSDPTARARVRFFIDVVVRDMETPMFQIRTGVPGAYERLIEGLEKIQRLLPDPDAAEGGEYAIGKDLTNADCALVPILALLELAIRTNQEKFEPGLGKKLGEALAGAKFDRLRRYKNAVWKRESVKKAIDLVSCLCWRFPWILTPVLVFRTTWRAYGGRGSLRNEERSHDEVEFSMAYVLNLILFLITYISGWPLDLNFVNTSGYDR